MYSAESYQSIKDPSDLEDEQRYNAILSSLLEEFDPECGNYASFKQGCIRQARRIMKEREWENEEEEESQIEQKAEEYSDAFIAKGVAKASYIKGYNEATKELQEQIEKMKCWCNCKNYLSCLEECCRKNISFEKGICYNCKKWELRR